MRTSQPFEALHTEYLDEVFAQPRASDGPFVHIRCAAMIHDRDGAQPGRRLTSCGDCCEEFPGKTAQESADACKAHQAAGCPKKRRIVVTAKDPANDKLAAAVETYLNATIDVDAVIAEASAAAVEELLWS